MGTEIIKSFGVLQSELEQAKSSLKGVDENIKRLIGRDPSEIIPRPGIKRGPPPNEENNRGRGVRSSVLNRNRNFNHENDEPLGKRRNISVFKRLSERPVHYEDELLQQPQKQLISKVIVTPREVPSRQEALAAQRTDEKSKARNKRMFGALLGTLQKFQQEETKLKSKEQKRAQVEKKIEEHEIREKAEIKKERQELFFNRKKKQAEIKMIELKMTRMKEYAVWEERQKPRVNFILTKAKPHICFLPRRLNDTTKALLENCKNDVEKLIEKRRQDVFTELQHIEDRMKRNFEPKKPKDAVQEDEEVHEDETQEENDDHQIEVENREDTSGNENPNIDNLATSCEAGDGESNNITETENTALDGADKDNSTSEVPVEESHTPNHVMEREESQDDKIEENMEVNNSGNDNETNTDNMEQLQLKSDGEQECTYNEKTSEPSVND